MKGALLLCVCAALLIAAACGGSGDEAVPTPSPDAFDPNILTGLVLQPNEVPLPLTSGVFSQQDSTVLYTAFYRDGTFTISPVISRTTNDIEREQRFSHLRSTVNALVGGERNYELTGSELAFAYRGVVNRTPNYTVLVLNDEFIMMLTVASTDSSATQRVFDEAAMQKYVTAMFARITQASGDPASITPNPSAPTYAAPPSDDDVVVP